jgi:Ni,Fe-hydrogenase III small subunit
MDPSLQVPLDLGFQPGVQDNSKFKFDPNDVLDNSPQDQNPTPNTIVVLFTIVAPNETGSYTIEVSYPQGTSDIVIQVVSDTSAVSKSFASISKVSSPLTSSPGDMVKISILLQNNRTAPSTLFAYATNSSTKQIIFSKVYSDAPVAPNGTITLTGAFKMPNATIALVIHSGHVENGKDVDDDRFTISVLQSIPPPPSVPFGVLATEWAPWIALIGATLGSVPLMGTYALRGKRLSPKAEKLKLAVVECAHCSLCKTAMGDLEKTARNQFGDKIALAPIVGAGKQEPVDVAFVIGAIRTAEDVEAAKEARERAKVLVAFGACSAFGMWSPDHRRRVDANSRGLRNPSPTEGISTPTDPIRPVSDYVKVDLSIPGCPPPMQVILDFVLTEFKNVGRVTTGRIEGKTEERGIENV